VDGRGDPLSIAVTAAKVNDGKRIEEVSNAIVVKRQRTLLRRNKHLCADAGYRSAENPRIIDAHGFLLRHLPAAALVRSKRSAMALLSSSSALPRTVRARALSAAGNDRLRARD